MKTILLTITLCLFFINLNAQNISSKDTTHQKIIPFIRIGICVGKQEADATSIDNLSNGGLNYFEEGNKAAGSGLYPIGDIGVIINKRFQLDMEIDYQTGNYYEYDNVSYSPPYNINNYNSSETLNNEAIFLIPSVLITANPHLFTPYLRPGLIFSIVNRYDETYWSSYLTNGTITTSKSYPISSGILLDGGCDLRLSKYVFLFGEIYGKFINDAGYGHPASSIGISTGVKIVL